MAMAAALANAVFASLVVQPTSFLSAILGVELRVIPSATWDEMYRELRSQLSADPVARKRDALNKLIMRLARVAPDTPQSIEAEAPYLVRDDPENLLCRLAAATLLDFEAPAASPVQRFEKIRQTVDAAPRPNTSRLYNEEFTTAWHEIVKKHIRRADVAASTANSWYHLEIVEHYAALPRMQRRLSELAAELRTQDHSTEADTITRWLGQTLLGLIDSERDAGTRLLCADLMTRALGTENISHDLSNLRDAFKAQASASPPDATHPYRAPAALSSAYGRVWNWGIASMAALVTAIGILFASLLGSLTALLRRPQPATPVDSSVSRRMATTKLLLLTAALIAVFEFICVKQFGFGIYSAESGIFTGLVLISLGVLCVPLCCFAYKPPRGRAAIVRFAVLIILMALLLNFFSLNPASFNESLRRSSMGMGATIIGIIIAGLLAISSGWLSPVGSKTFASGGLQIWAVASVLALSSYQIHRWADKRYQQNVTQARLDEFPARLGPDWQDQYLKSARAAYDIPRP